MPSRGGGVFCSISILLLIVSVCVVNARSAGVAAAGSQQVDATNVSADAIRQFNDAIVRCIVEGDANVMEQLTNWPAMENKMSAGIECHPEVRAKCFAKMKSGFVQNWVTERHRFSSRGGSFQFRRVVSSKGRLQAIYRMITGDGGGNYYGLEISPNAAGELRITDFWEISRPMTACESGHFMLALLAKGIGKEIGAEATTQQLQLLKPVHQIRELQQNVELGHGAAALRVYESLPAELQSFPEVQYYRLRAAILLQPGGKEHRLAVDAIVKQTTDPLTRSFLELNYHTANKDGHQAALAGREIEKLLGPDAWIDAEIAKSFLMGGDLRNARKHAAEGIKSEPDVLQPYIIDMNAAAKMADFEAAANALRHVDRLKPLPSLRGIESSPNLARFVLSDVYQTWKQERRQAEQQKQEASDKETQALFEEFEATRRTP